MIVYIRFLLKGLVYSYCFFDISCYYEYYESKVCCFELDRVLKLYCKVLFYLLKGLFYFNLLMKDFGNIL